jgi:hypothetical protein
LQLVDVAPGNAAAKRMQRLGYGYLGDRRDRDNRNIAPTLLTAWLTRQGVSEAESTCTLEAQATRLLVQPGAGQETRGLFGIHRRP